MEKLKLFIAECVCKGIELYVSRHRFGFNSMLEMLPLTHKDFEKHMYKVLTKEGAKDYLDETTPTIHPHL